MNAFLEVFSGSLGPDEHAVLVMENAGGHHARALRMPENVTPLCLTPYSPELNPIERLWGVGGCVKSHQLSNRAYETYDHLLEAGADAFNRPTKQIIASVCITSWLTPDIQM